MFLRLIAMGLLALVLAGCEQKSKPSPQAKTPNESPRKESSDEPTIAQCREFAKTLHQAVRDGSPERINALVAWDMLIDRGLSGLRGFAEQQKTFRASYLHWLKSQGGLANDVNDLTKRGGSVTVVAVGVNPARVVVRLLPPGPADATFRELSLSYDTQDRVRIVDFTEFGSAESLSHVLRKQFLGELARDLGTKNEIRNLDKKDLRVVQFARELTDIRNATFRRDFDRVIVRYQKLPADVQDDPGIRLAYCQALVLREHFAGLVKKVQGGDQSVGPELYSLLPMGIDKTPEGVQAFVQQTAARKVASFAAESAAFRKSHPRPDWLDFSFIPAFAKLGHHQPALDLLADLKPKLANNAYLETLKAQSLLQLGQAAKAAEALAVALKAEPKLEPAHWVALRIALAGNHTREAEQIISRLKTEYGADAKSLQKIADEYPRVRLSVGTISSPR